MPRLTLSNVSYPWVSVRVQWGQGDKGITLARNSDDAVIDTGDNETWFAWKAANEYISNEQFSKYATRIDADASMTFGNPPSGKVP